MHAITHAHQRLQQALREANAEFLLLSALPAPTAHVQFIGPFQGAAVAWDMQLSTLAAAAGQFDLAADPARRGLILIAPQQAGVFPLRVAVRAPRIDLPTVHKVVIMMRNYKNLQIGLRVWADPQAAAQA